MLAKRLATVAVLLAVGLPALILGGVPYFVLIVFFVVGAAWEYGRLLQAADVHPAMPVLMVGTLALLTVRYWLPAWSGAALTLLTLVAMTVHLFAYERGRDRAGTDFAGTLGGLVYLGWIGAYLLDLRAMDGGLWWLLLVLVSVWVADSFAYLIGVRLGRHHLSPRLSPKKSWEGYLAGVVTGPLGGLLFAWLGARYGGLPVSPAQGAALGFFLALVTTLGDLGESMFKRQAGLKDSSSIFPGHGGFFDRIDSWLWAAPLGYYFIVWFIL